MKKKGDRRDKSDGSSREGGSSTGGDTQAWMSLIGSPIMLNELVDHFPNRAIAPAKIDVTKGSADVSDQYDFEGRNVIAKAMKMDDGEPVLLVLEFLSEVDPTVSDRIARHAMSTYDEFKSRVKGRPFVVYMVLYLGQEEWSQQSFMIPHDSAAHVPGRSSPRFMYAHVDFLRLRIEGEDEDEDE